MLSESGRTGAMLKVASLGGCNVWVQVFIETEEHKSYCQSMHIPFQDHLKISTLWKDLDISFAGMYEFPVKKDTLMS